MWGRTVRVPRLHDKPSIFVDEHIDIACRYRIHSARVTCSSPSFMMSVSKNDPIAIIGAGAFGLSTALELSNQGYTNITVFEKDEEIPSRWSAANDLNKIMRAEYEDDFYTDLAVVRRKTVSRK
jgi:heterodisulfide reductase subunit A-like polyferredoxin